MLDGDRAAALLARTTPARVAALQALVPIWQVEAEDLSVEGRLHVVRLLRRALRAERQRGHAYALDYSARRHADLLQACRLEEAALARTIRAELTELSAA